jgi:hypothetical protein
LKRGGKLLRGNSVSGEINARRKMMTWPDRWVPLSAGEKKRKGKEKGEDTGAARKWAGAWFRPRWAVFLFFFDLFLFLFSFYFLFSYFLHNFCISKSNKVKPIAKVF